MSIIKTLSGILILSCIIPLNAQQKLAAFRDESGLWGYLNIKGEIVIEPTYGNAKSFSDDGLALVKDETSGEYMYINASGEKLELDCSPVSFKKFHNRLAPVKIIENWGFINTEGKLVIPAKYIKVTYFEDDRAFVMDESEKISLINSKGEEIDLNGLKLQNYNEFSEGLARVQLPDGWGFIDTSGNLVIEAKYDKVGDFENGLAWVRFGKGATGFIDKTGKLVIEPKYNAVKDYDPVSGLVLVNKNKEWVYIDKEGNEYTFDIRRYNDFSDGLLMGDTEAKPGVYGYLNKDGEWVIEQKFERAEEFHYGVARVRVDGLWGLIDESGNYIIEPKYERLEDFDPVD